MTERDALEAALIRAGSDEWLAKAIGCSRGAIWRMKKAGRASARFALRISQATGVPVSALRPDLYPPDLVAPDGSDQAA
mgnify:CR=1 FL=1